MLIPFLIIQYLLKFIKGIKYEKSVPKLPFERKFVFKKQRQIETKIS